MKDAKDLLDELDQPEPERWKPEQPGDRILGRVVSVGTYTGKFGRYPTLVLATAEGAVEVAGKHTVLKSQLERLHPQVGDLIAIKYLGMPVGKNYENYKTISNREPVEESSEWGADREPPEDEEELPEDTWGAAQHGDEAADG